MTLPGDLRRILLEACVLVAFGALVGLSLHYQLVLDAFSGRLAAPPAAQTPAGSSLPVPALLAELDELVRAGALLVDARAAELYAEGHLPGAVSLPLGEADGALAAFRAQVPAARILVTYCSGYGCPDSFDLGVLLIQAGYQDVRVYEGGLPEWQDAGRPVQRGAP